MIDVIGWLGAFCFAVCSVPQAVQCFQQKHARGVSGLFLALWVIGEILSMFYVLLHEGFYGSAAWPLVANYSVNLFGISIIVWYKLKP